MSTVWICVTLEAETDKAWMVDGGTDERVWLPKSQIMDYSENEYKSGDTIEIEVPEWLAFKKGLI